MTPTAVPMDFTPEIAPVLDSLTVSALVALVPLVTIFVTLGLLKWKAHWAGLTAVAVAILVAVVFFGMPAHLAALAATEPATVARLIEAAASIAARTIRRYAWQWRCWTTPARVRPYAPVCPGS